MVLFGVWQHLLGPRIDERDPMRALAVVIAIVCLALAVLYWTGLLQFGVTHPGPHHTHAILFAVIGVLALVWLRFQSGARSA